MTWGIQANAPVHIYRKHKDELEEYIDELTKRLAEARTEILLYAVADPKSILPNEEDILDTIKRRVNDVLDDIEETVADQQRAHLINEADTIIEF